MLARRMSAKIIMSGTDVTENLSPYLRGIEFEDELSGSADSVELELTDIDRLFIDSWFPDLSGSLDVTLIKKAWENGGASEAEELPLGEFEIDEGECSYAPSICKIKAISISELSELRQKDEFKSFEKVKLSEIAAQIANDSGVSLVYQASDDPQIDRAEQNGESRLAFLEKLCKDNYLALKVSDKQLIIFDESELDKQEPVMTIERDKARILHFNAKQTIQDVYKSCEVFYKHDKKAESFIGKFDAPGKDKGKILRINKKCETQADADKLAKNSLREKNKKETTITMTLMGDFALLAGNVVELKKFGHFNGRYLIERASHSVGDSYEVRINMRRCLEY